MADKADITMDEARGLVSDAALWPRVRDFLWDFASQVHPDWLEGLPPACDMGSPRVRRYVLELLGVEPCFHLFPKDDGSRLLLLDRETLESVAKWLGALACAADLRRVTSGRAVRELKESLPGIYPEVFGYTMYFGGFDFERRVVELQSAQRISEEGCKMLFSVLSKLPGPLIRRMELKFPKGLCDLCLSAPLREINYAVVLKLLKLKFPEAYSLCC